MIYNQVRLWKIFKKEIEFSSKNLKDGCFNMLRKQD